MVEKNTEENKKSKKKHRWIGIFLIAVLLLFIGLAGYYLERDLEPVPDNQVEENEIVDQDINGSEEGTDIEEDESDIIGEDTEADEKISDSSDSTAAEKINVESDSDSESENGAETQSEGEKAEDLDTDSEIKEAADDAAGEDKDAADGTEEIGEDSAEEAVIESGDSAEDAASEGEDSLEDAENKVQDAAADTEDRDEDSAEEAVIEGEESAVENDTEGGDSTDGVEVEDQDSALENQTQDDLTEQTEDSSLIEQVLSILGLSESEFEQDLNILFVGLDDEESVAIGSVEADSIMLGKLRPEDNRLEIKNIDEDTNYKGQLLRDYHDEELQLAVEEISETEIDYYVFVKYQGFEKVIDELGGVKITLEQEVKVPGLGLDLKEGDNLLSGKEALNFVRWKNSDSMARFERQKVLINSVISKLKGNNILFNVKDLYNTIVKSYNSIETDINPVLAAEIFNYIRENDDLQLEFIN